MAKKNITLNRLAEKMDTGFTTVHKEIKDLTEITQKSFNEVEGRINNHFDKVGREIKELKQGQENIELKLTNVAYRFELEEIKQRVIVLEKKLGVKS